MKLSTESTEPASNVQKHSYQWVRTIGYVQAVQKNNHGLIIADALEKWLEHQVHLVIINKDNQHVSLFQFQ